MRIICSKTAKVFLVIATFLLQDYSNESDALAGAPNVKWQSIVNQYLELAFASGHRFKLIKFSGEAPIPIEINCSIPEAANCLHMTEVFKHAALESTNVKFVFSSSPKLRIELFDHINAKAIFEGASQAFKEGFADATDHDCAVFYTLQDNEIRNAEVIISADQDELKIKTCIAIQLSRALGLGNKNDLSFSDMWNLEPLGLKNLSDDGLGKIADRVLLMEHIHMCPELKVGMTVTEVREELEAPDSCIAKLGGIK